MTTTTRIKFDAYDIHIKTIKPFLTQIFVLHSGKFTIIKSSEFLIAIYHKFACIKLYYSV